MPPFSGGGTEALRTIAPTGPFLIVVRINDMLLLRIRKVPEIKALEGSIKFEWRFVEIIAIQI